MAVVRDYRGGGEQMMLIKNRGKSKEVGRIQNRNVCVRDKFKSIYNH